MRLPVWVLRSPNTAQGFVADEWQPLAEHPKEAVWLVKQG